LKETAEIEIGMAEKSSWDKANRLQKLGLVWRIRNKISQIIKDYFYLPFFLLIILWLAATCLKQCGIFKIKGFQVVLPCAFVSFRTSYTVHTNKMISELANSKRLYCMFCVVDI
jgi:hypothetical protein